MQRVLERILNLLAFLLTVDRPVTAEEIRHTVAGYEQDSDEAFRRTFERDKDLLRRLGVPLRREAVDAWEVEHGYVIPSHEYALADPGLTDEERAALWLAAHMVRLGGQAPDSAAIFKLGGAPMAAAGEPLAADLGAASEHLADLFAAITERRMIRCTYRDAPRVLESHGLVHRRGHWYLVATQSGSEPKAFRVDRITDLHIGTEVGAFQRPPGIKVSDALAEAPWEAGAEAAEVVVRFDPDVAWWARRHLTARATVTEGPEGDLVARFPVANPESLVGWMIGFEDHAEILEPESMRARMIDHLLESG
jgi:predicted DNA-binding transcriptional regulator YafY